MPQRPRQHELETESRLAFEQALGSRFVYRVQSSDYGIDAEVEEFDSSRQATGLRYLAQLKGTDESDLSKALQLSLKKETAAYYRSLALPVLMVRYLSTGKRLFVRWFHNPLGRERGGKKYRNFRWSENDEWREDTPERLAAEARAFMGMRSARLSFPFDFTLDVPETVFGLTSAEIAIAIRAAAKERADVIRLIGEPRPDAGVFRVSDGELAIGLPGSTAATLSIDDRYEPGDGGEQLATDVLALTALAFERWGQDAAVGRLASTFFAESALSGEDDAGAALAGAMVRSRQIRESLELSEKLDAAGGDRRSVGMFFTLAPLHHGRSLSREELEAYRQTLQARIERRKREGDLEDAARNCVSLANSHRSFAEPAEAVPWYRDALELDPGYAEREHYWRELAGVLFGSHEYAEAAEAYERAVDLGTDAIARFLYADSLLFAGEYRAAGEAFKAAVAHDESASLPFGVIAEYGLKQMLLHELLEVFGPETQKRRPAEAVRAAEVPEQLREDLEAAVDHIHNALELDALCPLAWWNLSYAEERLGRRDRSALHALAAALCREGDVEAWANATVGNWYYGDVTCVPAIVVTGERMTDGALLPRLGQMAREQGDDFPRANFMRALDEMASELSGEERTGYTLRLIQPDGTVKKLDMPALPDSE